MTANKLCSKVGKGTKVQGKSCAPRLARELKYKANKLYFKVGKGTKVHDN